MGLHYCDLFVAMRVLFAEYAVAIVVEDPPAIWTVSMVYDFTIHWRVVIGL